MLLAAALLVSACGGSDTPEAAGSPSTSDPRESTPSSPPSAPPGSVATTTTQRGPLGSGEPVTLAFAGDVTFQGLEESAAAGRIDLLDAIAPTLGAADLTVVNLEAALTEGGTPESKRFTFRVPASALDVLGAAGVDVVTMANNHGMDFGPEGLEDSLEIRDRSELAVIGIGRDEQDAYRPHVVEIRGQRIGVISANDVFDDHLRARWVASDDRPGVASTEEPEQDRFVAAVRALRAEVDTLAVYLHYGLERQTCPNDRQKALVDMLVDAGADIIVGTHAHRLQGMGFRGDTFVAYGLSNFVFRAPSEEGRRSGVLRVTATGRRIDSHDWAPARIGARLVPVPLTGDDEAAARRSMDELRGCTDLTESAR